MLSFRVIIAAAAFVLGALAGDASVRGAANKVQGCASAISLIEQGEGYRDCTYVDTTGHKTICYGFNLETGSARGKIEHLGLRWDRVYNHCGCKTSGAGCVNQHQCESLLKEAVDAAAAGAKRVFGRQCDCVQNVLTDMTYNLGEAGISKFGTFRKLIQSHQWNQAANDLYGTLWCKQVGTRCTRNAGIISHGC